MARRQDEDLEQDARRLRALADVDDRFCPDVIFVADRLKALGYIADFVRVPDEKMPADEALYDGTNRSIYLRESIFFALDRIGDASKAERRRARFTLAHEFGHVLQPVVGQRFRGTSGQLAEKYVSGIRLDEIEANRFAAAFLIPNHLAPTIISVEDLSDLFDVNITVARARKVQLERLQRRANNEMRPLPDGVVEFLRQGRRRGYAVPSLDREDERRRREAKAKGFEEIPCNHCESLTLKRDGDILICKTCEATQGLGPAD